MTAPWCQYIVIDWQTPTLAGACLWSIQEHEPTARVYAVDAFEAGLSYSQAVHKGVRETGPGWQHPDAVSPIVCALNADTQMLGSQDDVRAIFDEYPEIAIIGPRQRNSAGLVTHAGILGTNEAPYHRHWLQPLDAVAESCSERILDAFSVSGAVYYCRRSVWDELGGFLDTKFFYEETWLSVLARHRGYRVVYTGQTDWIHEWSASPTTERWRAERAAESHAIFRAECDRLGITHN